MSGNKKQMPASVQFQQTLYQQKLARARVVKRPGLLAYNEVTNPATGEPFAGVDLASKMKRLNAWLKSNDKDYWDQHFAVQANRPAAKVVRKSPQGAPGPSTSSTTRVLPEGEVVRKYWEVIPGKTRMDEVFGKPTDDGEVSYFAELDFSKFSLEKPISQIVLEILVDCKTTDEIVGHVAVVEVDSTDQTISDGLIFGSRYGSAELTSGRKFLKLSVPEGSTLESATCGKRVIVKRKTCDQQVFLRRWVEYTVQCTNPEFSTGKVVKLAHLD
ncbi:coat protein [Black currant leaf chlorosis associated virus]|uniref:coat protein n=1 Tax=Black currant leaf chlorosis associated virus TaxID=1937789 RepID=UPI000A09617E|nr:coat protein [Black currant leaf chlorosis associated virus]ARH56472.1 coat protein [Black currant leaf chlorosis associated virus]